MIYQFKKADGEIGNGSQTGEIGPVHLIQSTADSEYLKGEIWEPLGDGQFTLDMA